MIILKKKYKLKTFLNLVYQTSMGKTFCETLPGMERCQNLKIFEYTLTKFLWVEKDLRLFFAGLVFSMFGVNRAKFSLSLMSFWCKTWLSLSKGDAKETLKSIVVKSLLDFCNFFLSAIQKLDFLKHSNQAI